MGSYVEKDADDIIALIDEVGLARLSGPDGCMCGGFVIRGLEVDIACGKGRDRAVWVSSRHMDWSAADAEEDRLRIGRKVATIVNEADGRGDVPVYAEAWTQEAEKARRGAKG